MGMRGRWWACVGGRSCAVRTPGRSRRLAKISGCRRCPLGTVGVSAAQTLLQGLPTVFLTISTTGTPERPATDLGFLLHKHPDKAQAFSTSLRHGARLLPRGDRRALHGRAAAGGRPVALVRRGKGKGRGGAPDAALAQYVNDRPYAASSLLAVALSDVFRSAMQGACDGAARAGRRSRCRCGSRCPRCPPAAAPSWSRRLFEPLGWTVDGRAGAAGRAVPRVGRLALRRLVLDGRAAARRRAAPPVRPAAGARRRQALLGRARRGRQAAAGRRGLAGRPPGAEADHQPLSVAPLVADPAGHGAAGTGAARRGRRQRGRGHRQRRRRGRRDTEEKPVPLAVQRRDAILAALRAAGAAPGARSRLRPGPVGAGAAQGRARSPRSSASTCRCAR